MKFRRRGDPADETLARSVFQNLSADRGRLAAAHDKGGHQFARASFDEGVRSDSIEREAGHDRRMNARAGRMPKNEGGGLVEKSIRAL